MHVEYFAESEAPVYENHTHRSVSILRSAQKSQEPIAETCLLTLLHRAGAC